MSATAQIPYVQAKHIFVASVHPNQFCASCCAVCSRINLGRNTCQKRSVNRPKNTSKKKIKNKKQKADLLTHAPLATHPTPFHVRQTLATCVIPHSSENFWSSNDEHKFRNWNNTWSMQAPCRVSTAHSTISARTIQILWLVRNKRRSGEQQSRAKAEKRPAHYHICPILKSYT